MICDFCSAAPPAWRYPAATFMGPFRTRSVDDWLACTECHRLIEAGDRNGLAQRAVLNPGPAVCATIRAGAARRLLCEPARAGAQDRGIVASEVRYGGPTSRNSRP